MPARPLRVHYLQHVPFEGLGSIAPWLAACGARVSGTHLYESPSLPALADFDVLIALGGPMSVNDERVVPWLVAEKELIADAIAAHRHVLGICLGAQLIAAAAGARVYANGEREIGWHPLERVGDAAFGELFAAPLAPFHWHGETFDLPAGTVCLARSAACERQAFVLGERVLGLQFHLETTPEGARALIENCPGDLAPGRYVQTGAAMLGERARFARINATMDAVLKRFLEPR